MRWSLHFSSDNSDVKVKPCSRWPCTAVTSQNEELLKDMELLEQDVELLGQVQRRDTKTIRALQTLQGQVERAGAFQHGGGSKEMLWQPSSTRRGPTGNLGRDFF